MNLTNTQKYIVQGMLAENKSIDEIVVELEVDKTVVESYLEQLSASMEKIKKNKAKEKKKAEAAAQPKAPTVKDKMKSKTDGGSSGVSIMTGAASEHADATRGFSGGSKFTTGNIYRPETGKIE